MPPKERIILYPYPAADVSRLKRVTTPERQAYEDMFDMNMSPERSTCFPLSTDFLLTSQKYHQDSVRYLHILLEITIDLV
jgi:hypothetical protein